MGGRTLSANSCGQREGRCPSIGQRKWDAVSGQLKDIEVSLGTQPKDFMLGWSFEGTTHFISQDEAFATVREWLLALLAAFSGTTRDAMVAAVETAQAQFVATDSASRTSGQR